MGFDIEEAKEIVDSGMSMPRRDEDSHDILGTFKILSNCAEMMRVPTSPEESSQAKLQIIDRTIL